jgi:hypothetical protein
MNEMAKFGFGCDFYDLKYFDIGISFHNPWIYELGGITKIRDHQYYVNSIIFLHIVI